MKELSGALSLANLLRHAKPQVACTWLLVVVEVALLAAIPLFLGRAIDALIAGGGPAALTELGILLLALTGVGVGRRVYDTRAYGTLRVRIGAALVARAQQWPVSHLTARLAMSREIVDFLEEHAPSLITAVIRAGMSLLILFSFDARLGYAALVAIVAMAITYGLFHKRFFDLNGRLNALAETQVEALNTRKQATVVGLLRNIRSKEVSISDTNSVLYGLVFLLMFALILSNLWFASLIPGVTAGAIFAILTYSWEVVESSVALPDILQQWTRLSEIQNRINAPDGGVP